MKSRMPHKNKGIEVKCPNCGHEEELGDLAGWSFIILKSTKCERCKATITHNDIREVIRDE